MSLYEVAHYLDEAGRSPFRRWVQLLNRDASAKVMGSLYRLAAGNFSSVKPVGKGVLELRIHFGPGYRVYFGRDGERLIVLLGGGSKLRQSKDIELAQHAWREYRARKTAGPIPASEDPWP